jgi:DNA processing protein
MPLNWVALNAIKGLGPVTFKRLLDEFGSPDAIVTQKQSSLMRVAGVTREVATAITGATTMEHAEEQIRRAQTSDVDILTLDDGRYPQLLRQIFAPPPVLFVKGTVDVFERHAFGVVGTRKATPYGERVTRDIAGQLSRKGIAVVSGLARGIDTFAHRAAIESGGHTIAVLGCGIDRVYPSQNKALFEQIPEKGVIVTEFPFGTPPEAFNFPRRNRIISGLSAGVLVVEAGKRSGALITVSYALQQGREVMAVPGEIYSSMSDGTFELIKNGAVPVKSADDIAAAIEVVRIPPVMESVPGPTQPPIELLSDGERIVLQHLSDKPLRMDQIIEKTQKVVSELFDILLNLELKGMVRQIAGQQYVRL